MVSDVTTDVCEGLHTQRDRHTETDYVHLQYAISLGYIVFNTALNTFAYDRMLTTFGGLFLSWQLIEMHRLS